MSNIIIKSPHVEIDAAIKELTSQETERCTILHCRYFVKQLTWLRIWPTDIFLFEDTGGQRKLLKAFNICLLPERMFVNRTNQYFHFTLVFEGLGKDCSEFKLLEKIPESGGFYSNTITRNKTDVYQAEILF